MCITQFVAEIALFRPPLYYAVRYFKLKKKKNSKQSVGIYRNFPNDFHAISPGQLLIARPIFRFHF